MMDAESQAAAATSVGLPYRRGVGIMLLNPAGLIWIGRRLPKWVGDKSAYIWQMPQGGICPGEDPLDAALRELEEETSVRSVDVLGGVENWLSYDLPAELVGVALKGRYRGQRQKWFCMRFLGSDADVDIGARNGHKAEFDSWRWAGPDELVDLAVPFKRPIYETVLREFAHLTR